MRRVIGGTSVDAINRALLASGNRPIEEVDPIDAPRAQRMGAVRSGGMQPVAPPPVIDVPGANVPDVAGGVVNLFTMGMGGGAVHDPAKDKQAQQERTRANLPRPESGTTGETPQLTDTRSEPNTRHASPTPEAIPGPTGGNQPNVFQKGEAPPPQMGMGVGSPVEGGERLPQGDAATKKQGMNMGNLWQNIGKLIASTPVQEEKKRMWTPRGGYG